MIHEATKTDGKLVFSDLAAYKRQVAHYKDGTRFVVTVERYRPSLTDDQRRWYFSQVRQFCSDEWGSDAAPEIESLHRHLSARFLTDATRQPARVRSITDLNTAEMSAYCGECAAYLMECTGWIWQTPDEREPKPQGEQA